MSQPILFVDGLRNDIDLLCTGYGDLGRQILDMISDSDWLADITDRLEEAETRNEQVLELHRRAEQSTKHWEPCENHAPTPEKRREFGGWIELDKAMRACDDCTYTEHYHCVHDAHESCGHDDYPCATAKAAGAES